MPEPEPRPTPSQRPRVRRAPSLEPPTDDERPALRSVPTGRAVRRPAPEAPARPARVPVDPAVTVLVGRVLNLALEVWDGRRSPRQLDAVLPPPLVQAVTTRAREAVGTGLRPGRVDRVYVQAVTPSVVEANGLVRRGDHAHAVAARVELVGRSWRCTALWLG